MPPQAEDNFDLKHVNNNDWKDADAVKDNLLLLRRNSVQALFKGYHYDKNNHQVATPSTKQNSIIIDSASKDTDKELGEMILGGEENVNEEDGVEEVNNA